MRRARQGRSATHDPFDGLARVHNSVCYDLLISFRVLYSPRTYPSLRGWAAAAKESLSAQVAQAGRFYFQGHDTSMGIGALWLVPELPDDAGPEQLIEGIRASDPRVLAMHMLDSPGDTPADRLELFRRALDSDRPNAVTTAVRGLPTVRKQRARRILEDPARARHELAEVLTRYNESVFAQQIDQLTQPLTEAVKRAEDTLDVLPTSKAVEHLSGGFTISTDWPLRRLTLAPSVFLHPFASVRMDESTGEALVVYGIESTMAQRFDAAPVDASLVYALKVMSVPARLQILRLLSRGPLTGPELVRLVGLSQPTVHHHVAALRAAELVRQERVRNGTLLSLRDEGVEHTLEALAAVFRSPGPDSGKGR
ncbi:ArsR/SmtB family transcription factor [Jiangella asiatica]|uniref:ArsR family transcriptional regulator n=1 Tax=Jiangella asiatica TaxID=2530372 RepID=A0A4V2Z3C9_9ACTN|nr:winged helix-turn-helix domain-containing protein [Jiangella asiatica]TDE12178.1 ArsR family transcriptional regulator [Jiangella asiatica]